MIQKQQFRGYWNIDFNLYSYDEIDLEETKESILSNFRKNHYSKLQIIFSNIGLRLIEVSYYSPRAYNFDCDSIDLELSILDKEKYINFLKDNKEAIENLMLKNKSYDGYIALTNKDINEAIEKAKDKNDIDTMSISFITLNYPLDVDEDLNNHFCYDEDLEEVE